MATAGTAPPPHPPQRPIHPYTPPTQVPHLVKQHLTVLVIILGSALERLLICVYNADSLLVMLAQLLGQREREPVVPVGRLQRQELLPRLDKTVQVAHLHLEQRQVAQDLTVVSILTQCPAVALDSLQVLPVRPVEQPVHVPADMALDVLLHALPHQLVRLSLPIHAIENQPLHRHRLAMVCKLLEDRIGRLQPLFVLLGLIVLWRQPIITLCGCHCSTAGEKRGHVSALNLSSPRMGYRRVPYLYLRCCILNKNNMTPRFN